MRKNKLIGIAATLVVAGIIFSAVAAGPALAAKGGNGGKPSGSTPVLSVTPNRVALGAASVVISGSGFGANQDLWINTGAIPSPTVITGANGSFSFTYYHSFDMPETATMQAWGYKGRSQVLLASTSYTVCSTNPCQ